MSLLLYLSASHSTLYSQAESVVIYLSFSTRMNLLTKFRILSARCCAPRVARSGTTIISLSSYFEADETLTEIDLPYQIRTIRHCSYSTILSPSSDFFSFSYLPLYFARINLNHTRTRKLDCLPLSLQRCSFPLLLSPLQNVSK